MTRAAWVLASLGVAGGCTVPNTDHCLHQKPNGHAWCIDLDRTRTFCSPCADAHHGCVAQPPSPTQCPEYEPPGDGSSESGAEASGTGGSSEDAGTGSGSTTAADPTGGVELR